MQKYSSKRRPGSRAADDLFFTLDPNIVKPPDGIDGVLAAKRRVPDLVITDVDMPRLDGHGVCRRLREDPATAGVAILMLTGTNDLNAAMNGLASGADDHITKPFSIEEVRARAQALLRGK
jgi:DNA-binding response OmpR family regulator